MAEYIEREALLKEEFTDMFIDPYDIKVFEFIIVKAPTTDVVEVVRCKDCVYFRESGKTNRTFCTYHGNDYEFETHRNKFCSDGVKAKLKE